MKTFKEYISERISDAEKDDLERRKERHTRQAARNKENLKAEIANDNSEGQIVVSG